MKSSRKTVLVTGSAARIGACIASSLHARGFEVLVHCNSNTQAADALAEHLNSQRVDSALVVSADLTSAAGLQKLVEACQQRWDSLDLLVNNASRFYPTAVGQTTAWQWDDLINSNLRAPYFLSQGLLPALKKAGGSIINILDIHATRPMKNHAVYSIAKAGLHMMTLALAQELAPEIRVNGVAPGAILWPENEGSAAMQRAILDRVALGRLGRLEDIASAVMYLALDAPYVTGQVLAVDGGRTLNM